ncbi:lactonase family protein [Myxococcus sp. K15C18031901]|uniref:lactonase family protein n=1 Tax=Myxococcus dinghuensis TaxID=2906761 RepID=UPI0020A7A592|nr:lactonase family protein [Myxococcus dinghuensis]MCP3099263.1 lactonase family protein [Myxococcus dinghuensis]
MRGWVVLAMGLATGPVMAHDLVVDSTVNGERFHVITQYPTVLRLEVTVSNVHPTLPSVLDTLSAPLMEAQGFRFDPPPPLTVPVGGAVTYVQDLFIPDRDACEALLATGRGTVPSLVRSGVHATFGEGAAGSEVQFSCADPAPYTCWNTFFLSEGAATRVQALDLFSGALHPASEAFSPPLDGLAYSRGNHLMYGFTPEGELMRVAGDGAALPVGYVPTPEPFHAATMTDDDIYVGISGGHLFRLLTDFGGVLSQVAIQAPEGFQVGDLAFNPLDRLLYAYNQASHRLTRIDARTGVYEDFGPEVPVASDGEVNPAFVSDAAMFDASGRFYLFGSDLESTSREQSWLYAVDLTTSAFTRVLQTRVASLPVDGASCFP